MSRRLTLIELLLVVFILAAVAASAATLTDEVDVQARYDVTASRREQVRRAILGDEGQAISGFVADMGRLPNSLQELLEPGPLPAWSFDASVGAGAGWRGPYVHGTTEASGALVFRDGWGAPGGAPNFGWQVSVENDLSTPALDQSFDLVSFGRDGLPGGAELADRDQPTYPSSPTPAHLVLVPENRWVVNLKGWRVRLSLANEGSTAFTATTRLRLLLPDFSGGSLSWSPPWPATPASRDSAVVLSDDQAINVPAGGAQIVTYTFDAGIERLVPAGAWAIELVDETTGARVGPGPGLPLRLRAQAAHPDLYTNPLTWVVAP